MAATESVDPEKFYTIQEVAELFRCDHQAIRRWIAAGRLRGFQPGHRILIRGREVQRLLDQSIVGGDAQ
ncbi:MAG TPA: helix-turn-helix domain-containing protein [Kribbellaceae bacterium]|nr:helix-turn-helix domain-containing protein [Kribbellaceae bacterium]